jgi:hypothetical protein
MMMMMMRGELIATTAASTKARMLVHQLASLFGASGRRRVYLRGTTRMVATMMVMAGARHVGVGYAVIVDIDEWESISNESNELTRRGVGVI